MQSSGRLISNADIVYSDGEARMLFKMRAICGFQLADARNTFSPAALPPSRGAGQPLSRTKASFSSALKRCYRVGSGHEGGKIVGDLSPMSL